MRYTFSEFPPQYEVLADKKVRCYYNIEKHTEEMPVGEEGEIATITSYECDGVDVSKVDYAEIVEAIIRKRYSLSAEIAILRQKDVKVEEFAEYNTYAENAKVTARQIVG